MFGKKKLRKIFKFIDFLQEAEKALKYYKGYRGESQKEDDAFYKEFERLKALITEQKQEEKFVAPEFCKYTIII